MLQNGNQRTMLVIGGGVLALILALILGFMLSTKHKDEPKMNGKAPGLAINVSDAPKVDSAKPIRCFVNGVLVGNLTLHDCAARNGVGAQQLDVGLDEDGNLAAAPTASLAPPPATPVQTTAPEASEPKPSEPIAVQEPQSPEVVPDIQQASGPVAPCLRYSGNQWSRVKDSVTLGQCVQLLYDGRCESPGNASYGRWNKQTLRLVPKKIEVSDDNKNFRTLVRQGQGCSVPQIK